MAQRDVSHKTCVESCRRGHAIWILYPRAFGDESTAKQLKVFFCQLSWNINELDSHCLPLTLARPPLNKRQDFDAVIGFVDEEIPPIQCRSDMWGDIRASVSTREPRAEQNCDGDLMGRTGQAHIDTHGSKMAVARTFSP